ncbi:MAG: panthothenate synthetase [Bacteroidota bacterium]
MRMLMKVKFPNPEFNAAIRKGNAGDTLRRIIDEIRPEAVYFSEMDGLRGAIMIVDVTEPARVPALAEPWFLSFNAEVSFHVVMSPDDLGQAGLDELGKKWV